MHPAYLGDFLLLAAALLSAASLIVYLLAWRGRDELVPLGRRLFTLASVAVTAALGTLLYLILKHDFTVAYVFSYSSTDLPLGYLISSLWGGQEGTFLLWAFYLGVMGYVMMHTARRFERGNMVFLNLVLLSLLIIMIKKSPFELMPVFRSEGAGLNPLLQNFWMQIHPPIMFVGFAATAFPFVFAMTGLVERRYRAWSDASRRWTIFAWASLGISLVLGGYWAYETLGWGGFWAWDPVENSSLIPWIFLTTQVHALFIKRQRRGMMRFSVFAVFLSFWSVLYGTFLTRSGVLADFSVHSFVDLGINAFLVSGLLFFIGLGSFFFLLRWNDIRPEPSYSRVNSRSYLVTLGIVVLFLGGVLVLLGTSAPLLTRFTENPSAVGQHYYFTTMTPIGVALLLLISIFPAFRWNRGVAKQRLLIIGGAVAVVTMGLLMLTGVTNELLYLLLFGFAAAAFVTNGTVFIESLRLNRHQPGYLSHVGLAVLLVGAAASAGFEDKQTVTLPQGKEVSIMGDRYRFTQVVETPKGFDCHVEVTDDEGTFLAVLPHEFPRNAEGVMKKPFVRNYLMYDLYLSPQALERPEQDDPGTLQLDKGASATLDKYTITFHDFELHNHGEQGEEVSAEAIVTVAYDGGSEEVRPALRLVDDQVTPEPAAFDDGRGTVYIAGVRPEDGSVVLKVSGDFLPPVDLQNASLVVEVSHKPLILLFWLGSALVFLGGLLSMVEVRRRRRAERETEISVPESRVPVGR